MNKFLFAAVVSLAVSCLASGGTGTVVLKENFDGDISKWEGLGFGWNVEPGVGTGGSKAIVWRTPAKGVKPQLTRCWLTGYRPGMKVEVTCRAATAVFPLNWGRSPTAL